MLVISTVVMWVHSEIRSHWKKGSPTGFSRTPRPLGRTESFWTWSRLQRGIELPENALQNALQDVDFWPNSPSTNLHDVRSHPLHAISSSSRGSPSRELASPLVPSRLLKLQLSCAQWRVAGCHKRCSKRDARDGVVGEARDLEILQLLQESSMETSS